MRHRRRLVRIAALAALALCGVRLVGWHHEGHTLIARAAVSLLPGDVPAFFREGADAIAHASLDPDQWRHQLAPQLTAAEAPNHYFHYELFAGQPLPPTRERYIEVLARMKLAPGDAGFLPYSIAEGTQRLMMAFAEHRKWPDDAVIRAKCLLYAGLLAHYSADLAQPLHCTVHWDGRADPQTHRVERTGIHGRVDGLLAGFTLADLPLGDAKAEPIADLTPAIHDAMRRSNDWVERLYAMEGKLPQRKGDPLDANVKAMTIDRAADGAKLTASLMLTAWRNSEHVNLPDWLDRGAQ